MIQTKIPHGVLSGELTREKGKMIAEIRATLYDNEKLLNVQPCARMEYDIIEQALTISIWKDRNGDAPFETIKLDAPFPMLVEGDEKGMYGELVSGALQITVGPDKTYPGICMEFLHPEDETSEHLSVPTVVMECITATGAIRALVWRNPWHEDYTDEYILFGDDD